MGHWVMFFCVYFLFHAASNLQQTLYDRVRVHDKLKERQTGKVRENSETSTLSAIEGRWIEK
jgi:hypothetical protein